MLNKRGILLGLLPHPSPVLSWFLHNWAKNVLLLPLARLEILDNI